MLGKHQSESIDQRASIEKQRSEATDRKPRIAERGSANERDQGIGPLGHVKVALRVAEP